VQATSSSCSCDHTRACLLQQRLPVRDARTRQKSRAALILAVWPHALALARKAVTTSRTWAMTRKATATEFGEIGIEASNPPASLAPSSSCLAGALHQLREGVDPGCQAARSRSVHRTVDCSGLMGVQAASPEKAQPLRARKRPSKGKANRWAASAGCGKVRPGTESWREGGRSAWRRSSGSRARNSALSSLSGRTPVPWPRWRNGAPPLAQVAGEADRRAPAARLAAAANRLAFFAAGLPQRGHLQRRRNELQLAAGEEKDIPSPALKPATERLLHMAEAAPRPLFTVTERIAVIRADVGAGCSGRMAVVPATCSEGGASPGVLARRWGHELG